MQARHRWVRSSVRDLELLEQRRLLASAAAAVTLPGVNYASDDGGLFIGFQPQTHIVGRATPGSLLTGRQTGDRAELARDFLFDNAAEMGVVAADINAAHVAHRATDPQTGITYITFRQMLNGLPIDNSSAGVNFTKFGEVINAGGTLIPGMAVAQQNAARPDLTNMIHPTLALRAAAEELGLEYPAQLDLQFLGGNDLKFIANAPDFSPNAIPINAQYLASEKGVRLAWEMMIFMPASADAYSISIDAQNGGLLSVNNMTAYFADHDVWEAAIANRPSTPPTITHDVNNGAEPVANGGTTGTYNVYPLPLESPYDGPRSLVVNPYLLGGTDPATSPSPYGWHDSDGDIDPDFTDSRGNNVEAHDDINNNNTVTQAERAEGGPGLDFDFPIDFTQEPHLNNNNRLAAITNLFYWNNTLHDLQYIYGFTEQFWNFQRNQYGRNGSASAGADPVQADALDGSGTSNANFLTVADGTSGSRMQMYRFTAPTPDRDGDLDAGVIAHEFGHGVSNRLHTNGGGQMANTQSRGMGEGWSDFFALMFSQTAADTQNVAYPIGTYVLNQDPITGAGIRRKPYSFNKAIDPLTWEVFGTTGSVTYPGHAAISRSTAVHNTGEIWCSALWDMNWLLINKHGYDADMYTGWNPAGTTAQRAGNKLALRLVIEAMRLSGPTNPSFTEARDNILAADTALTGGANQNEIWTAFARRGLGDGASTPGSTSTATPVISFDVPWADPTVSSATPTGSTLGSVSQLTFSFNQPMNTASFSVLDDVTSFTGPGGTDVKSLITGSSWDVGARVLTLNTSPISGEGSYTITIGPNILAADDNAPMDQDRDGTAGEPIGDDFSNTFSVTRFVGPDAFGYLAGEYPLQDTALTAGAAGVVAIATTQDDVPAVNIGLGANTFRFYTTDYTGNVSLFTTPNGNITFGVGFTSVSNSDLGTTPAQATIAPLWDDWVTNVNADDQVLYKLVDADSNGSAEWLIVQWDVHRFGATGNPVRFQSLLQLNTGADPGRIIFNYFDLDAGVGNVATNGASASVGIKDAGTQSVTLPSRRVLVSQNTAVMPWVQTGKAILLASDVDAPVVQNESYAFETGQSASFVFSENVLNFDATRLSVFNITTASAVVPTAVNYSGGTLTGTVTLANTLADGNYRVTIDGAVDGSGVRDAAGNPLDGDNSGVAGGDHVFNFFFMRGDADRDRDIDIGDFAILAGNFNTAGTFSDGDFDYSGLVDIGDFSILASKFNTTLAAAAARSGGSESLQQVRVAGSHTSPTATASPFSTTAVWSSIEQEREEI